MSLNNAKPAVIEPPTAEELELMAALEAGHQHKCPIFKLEAPGLAPTYEAAESEAAATRQAESRGWGDLHHPVIVTLIERYDA
jgi:hypothetical protein